MSLLFLLFLRLSGSLLEAEIHDVSESSTVSPSSDEMLWSSAFSSQLLRFVVIAYVPYIAHSGFSLSGFALENWQKLQKGMYCICIRSHLSFYASYLYGCHMNHLCECTVALSMRGPLTFARIWSSDCNASDILMSIWRRKLQCVRIVWNTTRNTFCC